MFHVKQDCISQSTNFHLEVRFPPKSDQRTEALRIGKSLGLGMGNRMEVRDEKTENTTRGELYGRIEVFHVKPSPVVHQRSEPIKAEGVYELLRRFVTSIATE